jgi:regulator of replication initiation timing
MALNEGTVAQESVYSLTEVAYHFQVTTDLLRSWTQRFAQVLSPVAQSEPPKFSNTDVAALSMVQRLLSQGLPDDQVNAHLIPRRLVQEEPSALALAHEQNRQLAEVKAGGLPQVLGDLLGTIANSQQSVLNSQSTLREMVGVVVQDNFTLKEENRKLRERMLELERVLAEYQRREETRKERLESRLRGLENTVAALQQQMAQLIQLQRQSQQPKRGWW